MQNLQDRHPRARFVGLSDSIDAKAGGSGLGSKGNKQNLIVFGVDDPHQVPAELLQTDAIQQALENRELEACAVGFDRPLDKPETLGIADVVADKESLPVHILNGW